MYPVDSIKNSNYPRDSAFRLVDSASGGIALEERLPRKLVAILYADVAGYSRLTGVDEDATHRTLSEYLDLIASTVQSHRGKVVHYAGDAVLARFDAAVDALASAVAIQTKIKTQNETLDENRKVQFRIGINLGDVIEDRGDIYGDGVNVAARLEGLAEPGGICISESVRSAVGKKLDLEYRLMGERQVKNISEPVRAYRVVMEEELEATAASPEVPGLTLPDKPSIAVLPFDNLSGDLEQQYFSDGIADDIITRLSHHRWFFVISRSSSFTYRARDIDVKRVAQELGVRYVLDGSVRKAGNRVRVSAQLIDAVAGHHIWAERYDRDAQDVFAVQDDITDRIVTAIEPEIGAVERQRAWRKLPDNLDAWTLYQRGLWHFYAHLTHDGVAEARRLFKLALEADPGFATAYADLAWAHTIDVTLGFSDDPDASLEEAARAAEKSLALDARDPGARVALGRVHLLNHRFDRAMTEMRAALELNPSFARAYYGLGIALLFGGKPEESIPQFEMAIRMNPRAPNPWTNLQMMAHAYLIMEANEKAGEWAEKAVQQPNAPFMPFAIASAVLGHLGRIEEARAMLTEAEKRKPGFSAETIRNTTGRYGQHSGVDRIIEGLQKAGLKRQGARSRS